MPKIKTSRTKAPPEGFDEIEDVLEEYQRQMRDAENEDHEGKRKSESLWPIMRISHTRSRWIYDLYYKREAISQELYDWLCDENVRWTGKQFPGLNVYLPHTKSATAGWSNSRVQRLWLPRLCKFRLSYTK
ncbi:Component of the SF3b subcomplex of the U2 snRNP [Cystobasidiomycetes sp. EMM_F5]